MIRLQDIADMAGVSRTTVSNVINGNTKRVSQKTIDKITAILKEQNYVPNMGSMMLSGHGSRIIGVVLGFTYAHGMQSLQDPFVGELIGNIRMETEEKGYYVMLIGGEDIQNVVDIASKWNVEGLIILGYNEERYRSLSRKLNKKMILIDAYPEGAYTFQNVGVDDYSGGYQIGEYLYSCGYKKALFIAETDRDSDYYRWMGFKQAMEKKGRFCSRSRYIVVPGEKKYRLRKYEELLPRFLEAGALAFSSDYDAIEALNFFFDKGIKVPDQISITGYDDSMYASMVRPKLTTVHQDVQQKAHMALKRLMKLIQGEEDTGNAGSFTQSPAPAPKEKMIVYKNSIQPSMLCETPAVYQGDLWKRLSQSKFRSSFTLKANDRHYVLEKGMDTVRSHATDFIRDRLAPAEPKNDGKQTPMRGHPVFIAQHATGTCCRSCLEKWHHIPKGRELTETEQEYIVNVIMEWISREMKK